MMPPTTDMQDGDKPDLHKSTCPIILAMCNCHRSLDERVEVQGGLMLALEPNPATGEAFRHIFSSGSKRGVHYRRPGGDA